MLGRSTKGERREERAIIVFTTLSFSKAIKWNGPITIEYPLQPHHPPTFGIEKSIIDFSYPPPRMFLPATY